MIPSQQHSAPVDGRGEGAPTKRADGVQPVCVLDAVQLDALLVPLGPLTGRAQLFFGRPGDIIDDTSDGTRSAVGYKVDLPEGG